MNISWKASFFWGGGGREATLVIVKTCCYTGPWARDKTVLSGMPGVRCGVGAVCRLVVV